MNFKGALQSRECVNLCLKVRIPEKIHIRILSCVQYRKLFSVCRVSLTLSVFVFAQMLRSVPLLSARSRLAFRGMGAEQLPESRSGVGGILRQRRKDKSKRSKTTGL